MFHSTQWQSDKQTQHRVKVNNECYIPLHCAEWNVVESNIERVGRSAADYIYCFFPFTLSFVRSLMFDRCQCKITSTHSFISVRSCQKSYGLSCWSGEFWFCGSDYPRYVWCGLAIRRWQYHGFYCKYYWLRAIREIHGNYRRKWSTGLHVLHWFQISRWN